MAGPVLVLGARSDIGRAIARGYAGSGRAVILAARRSATLAADVSDLEVRYRVPARAVEFDVSDPDPDGFFAGLGEAPGTVVMVVGELGSQPEAEADDAHAERVMRANYAGPARFLLAAARVMERGCIVGISSVAGERGRRSNFVYGSAKAGFTAFLSGLRNRLHGKVHVVTVKPGFVATRMTAGMQLPPLLTARAEEVARVVIAAEAGGRDVVYVRPVWRVIMLVIRLIPERVFKRLSL